MIPLILTTMLTAGAAERHTIHQPMSGWTAFGMQSGFYTAMGVVAVAGQADRAPFQPTGGPPTQGMTIGMMTVVSLGASGAAGRGLWGAAELNDWDRREGWGLAYAWPGALAGGLAMGAQLSDADPNVALAGAAGAAALGAGLGYWAGKRLAVPHNPGTDLGTCTWVCTSGPCSARPRWGKGARWSSGWGRWRWVRRLRRRCSRRRRI